MGAGSYHGYLCLFLSSRQCLAVAPPAWQGQSDKWLLAYRGKAKFSRRLF